MAWRGNYLFAGLRAASRCCALGAMWVRWTAVIAVLVYLLPCAVAADVVIDIVTMWLRRRVLWPQLQQNLDHQRCSMTLVVAVSAFLIGVQLAIATWTSDGGVCVCVWANGA